MQTTTNNERKRAVFAVTRSYQPARIERELLAQVFQLASHGVTNHSDANRSRQQLHHRATQETAEHELATSCATDSHDAHDCERERAA